MPRSLKQVSLVFGFSGLAILLLAALLLGRLAWAPLSAGPLTPWLTGRADAALPGLAVDVGEAALVWQPRSGRARIRLRDVRLETPSGDRIRMPQLDVVCAAWPLLFGDLRPHSLALDGAEISLDWRAADLRKALKSATAEGAGGDAKTPIPRNLQLPQEILERLRPLAPRTEDPGFSIGRLERISLGFREIRLTESASGTVWSLPDAKVAVTRDPSGWQINASATLLAASRAPAAKLNASARWQTKNDMAGLLKGELEALRLPRLAAGIPELEPLAGLDMPARLLLDARARRTGALADAEVKITAAPGAIAWPGLYPEPRAFSALRADLRYTPAAGRLEIREFAAGFERAELAVSGEMTHLSDSAPPQLKLSGGWDEMSTRTLVRYWPRGMAASGRAWIAENIPAGDVADAKLHVALELAEEQATPLPADAFRLDFRFADLTAHVLRPAPPLVGATGTARLTHDRLTMALEAGKLGGLPVTGSTVALSDLAAPGVQWGDVRLLMNGPLPRVLRLIDHAPMGYVSAFGMSPADAGGRVDLEAALRFPLLGDLPLEDVDIDIDAEITEFAIPGLREGGGFSDGRLSLAVDNESLSASGRGEFSGVPLKLSWREDFSPPPETPSSRYDVAAVLSESDLKTLGIDPGPYFAGRLAARMQLSGNGPELLSGHLDADLAPAALDLDLLGWRKPLGQPASLSLDIAFDAGETLPINNVVFESGQDRFKGTLTVDRETGALRHAGLERLTLGRTAIAGEVRRAADGGLTIDIAGPALDLAPLLEAVELPDTKPDAPPAPPLDVRIAVERAFGLDEVVFRDLDLGLSRQGGFWQRIAVHAGIGAEARLSLALGASRQEGLRAIGAHVDETGTALRGLGLFGLLEGGVLDLDGHIEGKGDSAKIAGRLRMRDFKLARRPPLGDALEKEERSQLAEFVGEEGLAFDEVLLPFTVTDGIVDLEEGRANGPDIGLTVEGQFDRDFERINVNGIIVPVYQVNSLLGKIPIIGRIFTGGSGGGLFALSYRVEGALKDPEVSVDPLTAILPGILRKPFEGSKGRIDRPAGPSGNDGDSGGP